MTPGDAILLAATLASVANTALQYYTQVSTYPLFAALPDGVFTPYHIAYERRLIWSIYAPYAVVIALGIALNMVRPDGIGWQAPAAMLALNLAIAPISILLAVPSHIRLSRQGHPDAAGIRLLLRANALRLMASALASAIGVALIATRG
jgi:hypothetical protein